MKAELLCDGSTRPVEADREVGGGRKGVYRGRRVGCGPAGTCGGLTQALCSGHMAFVISHWEKDSPLAPPLPPPPTLSSHLSLSDFPFLSLLLSGFKGLKCFSCLLCIKCPFRSPVLPSARLPPTLRSVKRKMAQRRRGC